MAALTTVDSSAWPTSGTATAVTAGLTNGSLTSSGSLTHVGSTDLWQGGVTAGATGYIEATSGASITLRIDAASGASGLFGAAPGSGDKGVSGFWVRAVMTDTTLAAFTGTPAYVAATTVYGSTPAVNLLASVIKNTSATERGSGLALFVYPNSGVASVSCADMGYCRGMSGVADIVSTSSLKPNVPFGRWVFVQVRVVLGASGTYDLIINGQTVSSATVNTGTTDAVVNALSFSLPALTGIKWQIGWDTVLPASWRSTGHPALLASASTRFIFRAPANSPTDCHWPVTFSGGGEGDCFTLTGTGTVAPRPISPHIGSTDCNERLMGRLAAGQSNLATTTKQYGTLQYGADGWAWVFIRNLSFSSTVGSLVWIKNTSGTTVADIRWDATGSFTQGTANFLFRFPSATALVNFDLGVAFNSDGRVRYLVIDNTNNFNPTSSTLRHAPYSGPLDNWTPANIGDIVVFDSAGSQTAKPGFSGISFHKYLPVAWVDSYVENQHGLTSFIYIPYTSALPGGVTDGTTVATGSTTGINATVIAHGSGAAAADKWILCFTNFTWTTDATLTLSTGGSLTGAGAAVFPTWMGVGTVTGTPVRSETWTETTSTATGKLLTSGVLDPLYIPPNCFGLLPLTGLLRGGLGLTGAGGATCTGDHAQPGAYLAGNSYSTKPYNNLRDCEAATVYTPYAQTDLAKWSIQVAGIMGRAGKTYTLAQPGTLVTAPALYGLFFGGIANALNAATTPALALTIAAREANAALSLMSSIVENDGIVYYEEPEFGTTYMFVVSDALACYNEFIRLMRAGIPRINRRGRIYVNSKTGTFPASDDGVHYNTAGASAKADGQSQNTSVVIAGTGRSGRLVR